MKPFIFTLFLLSGLSCQVYGHDEHHPAPTDGGTEAVHHEHMVNHWSAPPKDARRRNPVTASKTSLRRGKALYQKHCTACHGESGTGDGPSARGLDPVPSNLREMAQHHPDGDLAWKIAYGRGPMPAWQGVLKQKQIWDVVNYLKQMGKP